MPGPDARLQQSAYDPVWKTLHWIMAALMLVAIALGYYASTISPGVAPRPALLDIHKSLGVTLFALVIARLAWRLAHPRPSLPHATRFVRVASALAHGALYVLMLAMPLSGYTDSIAGGHPFRWFGLFAVPSVLPNDKALSAVGENIHRAGAYAVYALVTLHIAAALWHGMRRDGIMGRMLPAR